MSEKDLTWETKTEEGYLAKKAFNNVKNKTLKDFYKEFEPPKTLGQDPIKDNEAIDLVNNYSRIGARVLNKTLYEKP